MNASADSANARWLTLIDSELQRIFSRIGQGLDVAPAQRYRLEGLIAAAHADGIALDELLQFCRRNAPQWCVLRIDDERKTLQFDSWQTRAPVFPSTSD